VSNPSDKKNRYSKIIEFVFFENYKPGASDITFERGELVSAPSTLGLEPVKNPGDILASFRFRYPLPDAVQQKAPKGKVWIIRLAGRGKYRFSAVQTDRIIPSPHMEEIKVPDATPGIIAANAQSDEQALLAKVRYNRLLDIFTGVTCYSLQSHWRSSVIELGRSQVETDEVYVGIDRVGAQYSLPVQAKGKKDKMSIVQIEQDYLLCSEKFPALACRPIAAQFIEENLVALFDFKMGQKGISQVSERHYRLVPYAEISAEDLKLYREEAQRLSSG
jgi:hypothetical protein